MMPAVSPLMVKVGVKGVDVLLKEAMQAVETSLCVVKAAVLWDKSTIPQLKLSICLNQLGNFSPFQDKNEI